jgi:hypothetical protein
MAHTEVTTEPARGASVRASDGDAERHALRRADGQRPETPSA